MLPNIADLIKANPPEFGSDTAPPFEAVLAYATRLLGPLRRARVLPLAAEEAEMQIVMEPHQAPELESLVPLAKEIGTNLAGTRLHLANRLAEGRLKPDLRMFLALCLLLRLHPKFVPIKGETSMPADLPTEPSAEPEADQAAPPAAELEQAGAAEVEQPEQPGASEQPGAAQETAGQTEVVVEAAPDAAKGETAAPAQGFFAFAVEAREHAEEVLESARHVAEAANAVLETGGDTSAVWPVLEEAEAKLDSARQTLEKVKTAVKRVEDEAAEKEARRVAEIERQRQREEARQAAAEAKALAKAAKEAAKEAATIAKQAAQDAKLKAQEAAEKEKTAREAQLKLAQTSRQAGKRGAAQAAPAPASRGRSGRQGSMIATAGKEVEDERRGRLTKRLARGAAGEGSGAKPKPGPKPKPLSVEDFSRLASVPDKVVLRLVREHHLATTATKPKVLIERKAADDFVERYVSIEEVRKGAHGDEIEVALTAGQVPPVLSFPRGGVAFYERGYVKSLMEAFS